MSAATNVFGVVHDYATNTAVFSRVFRFDRFISGDPTMGWVAKRMSRAFPLSAQTAAWIAKPESRAWPVDQEHDSD